MRTQIKLKHYLFEKGNKVITSTPVCVVCVVDPNTRLEVEVEIRKLPSGLLVGFDGCYLESGERVWNPYSLPVEEISIPDNEEMPWLLAK